MMSKYLPAIFAAFFIMGNSYAQRIKIEKPEIAGAFVHIFNPNDTRSKEDTTWYTNDHTFIKDKQGIWHAYGIIGHHPVRPWGGETKFFHITANSLKQSKWEDHDYAMTVKAGVERVLWAPYVFYEKGVYHMFYNIGNMQANAPDYASICIIGNAITVIHFSAMRGTHGILM